MVHIDHISEQIYTCGPHITFCNATSGLGSRINPERAGGIKSRELRTINLF